MSPNHPTKRISAVHDRRDSGLDIVELHRSYSRGGWFTADQPGLPTQQGRKWRGCMWAIRRVSGPNRICSSRKKSRGYQATFDSLQQELATSNSCPTRS